MRRIAYNFTIGLLLLCMELPLVLQTESIGEKHFEKNIQRTEEELVETQNTEATNDIFSHLSAPSIYLMEMDSGQVIYCRNECEERSPASITKIMTLLLGMEALREQKVTFEEEVMVSRYAASMGGSQVFLEEGEKQTFDTMLKCIAVASANDASVAIAEHIAGSENAFVEKMNEKAQRLGMLHTHFEDCCGLSDSDGHYTCAKDVAIMARELMMHFPEIQNYTQIWSENIVHSTRRGDSVFTLNSTNKLLKQSADITGLKTGSTNKAKYCFCGTATKNQENMVAVVLGCEHPRERFREVSELIQYGFACTEKYQDENADALPEVMVKHGEQETVPVAYQEPFIYVTVDGSGRRSLTKEIQLCNQVKAPMKQGEILGEAIYYLDEMEVGRIPILTTAGVEKLGFGSMVIKMFEDYLL